MSAHVALGLLALLGAFVGPWVLRVRERILAARAHNPEGAR